MSNRDKTMRLIVGVAMIFAAACERDPGRDVRPLSDPLPQPTLDKLII